VHAVTARRAFAAAVVLATLLAALPVLVAAAAPADAGDPPADCWVDPRTGRKKCRVKVDPTPSPAPKPPGGGGGEGGEERRCVNPWTGQEIPCHHPRWGDWDDDDACYWKLRVPQPPYDPKLWEGHPEGDGAIYTYSCPRPGYTEVGMRWRASAPAGPSVTPAMLALRALRSLTLPVPRPARSPDGQLRDGRRYTVARAPTWFWTDPSTYRTLSARASSGGVWAQVTVTPSALTFRPGDGGRTVSCRGPGRPWRAGRDGQWDRAPGGCSYAYPRSTFGYPHKGQLTATYGIVWTVTWSGSGGESGTLPSVTTTTDSTFAVAEAQSVVVR